MLLRLFSSHGMGKRGMAEIASTDVSSMSLPCNCKKTVARCTITITNVAKEQIKKTFRKLSSKKVNLISYLRCKKLSVYTLSRGHQLSTNTSFKHRTHIVDNNLRYSLMRNTATSMHTQNTICPHTLSTFHNNSLQYVE